MSPASASSETSPFRIAVVGCGPKGLYCLESLAWRLQQARPAARVEVVVFEPSPHLGAGAVYEPSQPEFLRMNFESRFIDAWTDHSREHLEDTPDLLQWLERESSPPAPDSFLPRCVVGEYLNWCADQVFRSLSRRAEVRVLRARARRVERCAGRWQVAPDNSSGEELSGGEQLFDEVMISVGHEGWRAAEREDDWFPPSVHRIDHVYRVEQQLSRSEVPPGSAVAVRGFGLTWIDATLALTEGRGGRFGQREDRWTYEPSGDEPRVIRPYSRSRRPMLPKPLHSRMSLAEGVEQAWARGRDRLATLPRGAPLDFREVIWPAVMSCSAEALVAARSGTSSEARGVDEAARNLERWFDHWLDHQPTGAEAVELMRSGLAVATGRRPPTEAWAIGDTWRQMFPQIVRLISHGGVSSESWSQLAPVMSEMNRLAFGPPADNVARMLALIDAGHVDLDQLGRDQGASDRDEIDSLINAVLPPPTQLAEGSLLADLLQQGVLRRMAGGEGIEVDPWTRPVSPDGELVEGLGVFGRPTEGCVIGNNTVTRRLHDHPQRWAERVVRRLSECHA